MIIETLFIMGAGAYINRHVKVSLSPEAQAAGRRLIDMGLAKIPSVVNVGKLVASKAMSALPQYVRGSVPELGAQELEGIVTEALLAEKSDEVCRPAKLSVKLSK